MSGITIRIDKGRSPASMEAQTIISTLPGAKECKRHYSVRLSEDDMIHFGPEIARILELIPVLRESDWFDVPEYGTDEWANWMIDIHGFGKKNSQKRG